MESIDILNNIGENLRAIMYKKQIKIATLERESGITRQEITRYRNCKSQPSAYSLARICTALQISPAELYEVRK